MQLPGQYIDRYLPMVKEHNTKMNFIGHLDQLSDELQEHIRRAQEEHAKILALFLRLL